MTQLAAKTAQTGTLQPLRKERPIHEQLYRILREPILSGRYATGTKIPTEAELTRMYGVSRISVRRALQELAAEGLIEGRKGQGTFVRAGAHILTKHRYLFIDADMSYVTYPYTQLLLRGIQSRAQNLEFRLEIIARSRTADLLPNNTAIMDLIETGDFQGLIALPVCLTQAEVRRLEKNNIPVVFIGHMYDTIELGAKMVNVDCDSESSLRILFTHLIETGRKKIGFIGKPVLECEPHRELIRRVCAAADIEFNDHCYEPSNYGMNPATEACGRLLSKYPHLQAVICCDDLQAVGALQHLRAVGIEIPRQIAIAGHGNCLDEQSHFEITTVDTRIMEQGRMAAQCLQDLIAGKPVEKRIWLEPLLIRRKTT